MELGNRSLNPHKTKHHMECRVTGRAEVTASREGEGRVHGSVAHLGGHGAS
uniref:Probable fibrosin-1 long transcript protein n=1 Tax=Pan troglodytes TaxID=9598 RepID=G2HDV9_PANTR|nr:probable fibrosin-1 long transcript protein [Pan troglodytes]